MKLLDKIEIKPEVTIVLIEREKAIKDAEWAIQSAASVARCETRDFWKAIEQHYPELDGYELYVSQDCKTITIVGTK